jgi:hypothetical protein
VRIEGPRQIEREIEKELEGEWLWVFEMTKCLQEAMFSVLRAAKLKPGR